MAGGTNFKSYQRSYRTQNAEEKFSGGQVFTRAPLDSDKSRLLINYDITSEGESLSPRKGYVSTGLGASFNVVDLNPKITSDISITVAKDVIEEDDTRYCLAIANNFKDSDTQIEGINLYAAPAELWITQMDDNNSEYSIPLSEYDIESHNMYAISASDIHYAALAYNTYQTYNKNDYCKYNNQLCRCKENGVTGSWNSSKWDINVQPQKSYYYVPDEPIAHGIPIEGHKYLSRPVGCFAWGNDYYNFNTAGQLIRNIYQTAEQAPKAWATNTYYAIGDLCTYNSAYYRCKIPHTSPGYQSFDTSKWDSYTLSNAMFVTEKIEAKTVTASEASSTGFNMLSDNPFVFADSYQSGIIQLEGIFLYKNGEMIPEPIVNTPYKLRCFYSGEGGKKYKIKFSYREVNSSTFTDLEEKEFTITAGQTAPPELSVSNFKSPFEETILKIQAYLWDSGTSTYSETAEKEIMISIVYVKSPSSVTANRSLINYDLTKATGMVYWKNRIWLYGLAQEPTVIFASDVNNPSYFPYPHNTDVFDEPIVAVHPFNDTLLVFTRSTIYQLTLSSDGFWTRKIIQSNMNFSDFDARFVQVVKNMIFFKSGEYYYMIVPKTLSLQNELAIAPISKNIESFLDDFEDNVKNIFKTVYDYGTMIGDSLTLVNHYNYLDYEDVHNVYTFRLHNGLFANLVLLYNTIDRTWRTYIYESQTMYYPLKQDATKQCVIITPITIKMDVDGTQSTTSGIEFLERARVDIPDFYIPNNSIIKYVTGQTHPWQADGGVIKTAFTALHKIYNYQMFDSGYRNQNVDLNKRYRELQIKFNNISNMTLNFLTEFILDGDTRVYPYTYEVEQFTDPSSPNYGLLYISRTPVENLEVPGGTILASTNQDINFWSLDSSRFPEIAFWKARLKVSGKGYTPRFRLTCRSEERYEVLGYTWVYRLMYSR